MARLFKSMNKARYNSSAYLESRIVSRACFWPEDLGQPAELLGPAFDVGLHPDDQPLLKQGPFLCVDINQ